jgi:hypothetical protein
MKGHGFVAVGLMAACCLVVGDGLSAAENLRSGQGLGRRPAVNLHRADSSARKVAPGTRTPNVVGTLQYDNDVLANRDGTLAVPVGNRFDNGFADPHSINALTFRLAGCFQTPYPQARLTVFDVNPTAMTVMQLAQFSGGGACSSGTSGVVLRTAMLPAPVVGHSGPFIGAVFNTGYPGCNGMTGIGGTCEGVPLSPGGVDPGMGFHAIRVGGSMSTAGNLGTRNAILRATGDNLPVELMGFGVN